MKLYSSARLLFVCSSYLSPPIDKTFLCVKNMEMDEKKQLKCFATQFTFYAILVRVVWKYSFPDFASRSPKHVCCVPCEKSLFCRSTEREIHFQCFVLIYFLHSFSKKWIIFLTSNKINLVKASLALSPLVVHTQYTVILYYYFDYFLRVNVCRCLNMLNGSSQQRQRRLRIDRN